MPGTKMSKIKNLFNMHKRLIITSFKKPHNTQIIVRYAALAISTLDMFPDQADTGITESDKTYMKGKIFWIF